jgi:surface protein
MFSNCESIKEIDFFNLTTYNLTNMTHMFDNCQKLQNLNMIQFITNKVQDMSYLLSQCRNLKFIDFSSFNTSSVQNYEHIFDGLPDTGSFFYNKDIFNTDILNSLPTNWEKTNKNNA